MTCTYRPDRALKPWVLTIATNAVRDHWRRRRVEALVRGRPDEGPERPVPATAHADLEGRQAADWMTEQIAALPQAQREVVELCCLQGLAQTDVAAALGLPVNTVKTHLRRGRLRLAEALGRRRAVLQREAP
jgi:RNA polymerase sigma-70 factor (ECF subfamily)